MTNQIKVYEFMKAFDDDDLSMGAWQQKLEDAVTAYNEQHGTKYDPIDTFIIYLKRSKEWTKK